MSKLLLSFLCLVLLLPAGKAQTDHALNNEFKKLMLAFPGNFESVSKGGYDELWERYETPLRIPGTIAGFIHRDKRETKRHFECIVDIPDHYTSEQYKEQFARWAARLGALDLNGAKLAEFKDPRYADKTNWFISGKAWKFDNSGNNISADCQGFTIRLELLDLDQGGWQLRIFAGDRDIPTGI